jgi:hypothetical protein
MTMFNGIEVSPLALGTALLTSKLDGIKLVRTDPVNQDASGYVSLKLAKDAVEAAMDEARNDGAAYTRIAILQSQLDESRRLRADDADRAQVELGRWRAEFDQERKTRARVEERLRLAEAAITDHIFGRVRLPDLAPSEYDDYSDSPF